MSATSVLRKPKAELFSAALGFLYRGWSVIAVQGKEAVDKWRAYQSRLPTPDELDAMFRKPGVSGLAVILGTASGHLSCRDFDIMDNYERWRKQFPKLAGLLPTVLTARGAHVYHRGPNRFVELDDGEYRGDAKHYTVLPPSIHPSGKPYRWLIPPPEGDLPLVADPIEAGLIPKTIPASKCQREQQRQQTKTEEVGVVPPPPTSSPSSLSSLSSLLLSVTPDESEIIRSLLPTGPGQRHKLLFELARWLKGVPLYADADPRALRHIVRHWHAAALPFIRTKAFVDTWADFLRAWPLVRYPAGKAPLKAICRAAAEAGAPPEMADLGYEREVDFLAAICREFQRTAPARPFFLACRTAGSLLGVHHVTAWRWLCVLEGDGLLEVVVRGGPETGKANRYLWKGSL